MKYHILVPFYWKIFFENVITETFGFGFWLVCQRNEYFPHVIAFLVRDRGQNDAYIVHITKERNTNNWKIGVGT